MRTQLRAAKRPLAEDATPSEVVAAFDRWRKDQTLDDARRLVEQQQQARERSLGPLREQLRHNDIDPAGMDESAMRMRIDELNAAKRRQAEERQRLHAELERRRRADHLFSAGRFPRQAVEKIDALPNDQTPDRWIKFRDLLDDRIESGKGCLAAMVGDSGTGKTQLATILGYRSSRRLAAPRYCKAADLFRDIRRAYTTPAKGEKGISEAEILAGYAAPPLLVIDEVHQRAGTPAEGDILTNLIDRRYDDKLATILIANQDADVFFAALGPSVQSRFVQIGKTFSFAWPGLRRPEW